MSTIANKELSELKNFIGKQNLIKTSITIIIAAKIFTLANVFLDSIAMPFFLATTNKKKPLEKRTYTIFGVEVKIGKFIIELIKFIYVLILVFIMSKFA